MFGPAQPSAQTWRPRLLQSCCYLYLIRSLCKPSQLSTLLDAPLCGCSAPAAPASQPLGTHPEQPPIRTNGAVLQLSQQRDRAARAGSTVCGTARCNHILG